MNAQKHVLRSKKKQQFCLFFDGPFVDLGLDHSFDIKFFWTFRPFWNQKIYLQTNTLSASKGTVREHGTDSTKGGHPSPKSPGACVILPCQQLMRENTSDSNLGNSVLKPNSTPLKINMEHFIMEVDGRSFSDPQMGDL